MKKSRRILSLLLAMMCVCGMLCLPALADDEEVELPIEEETVLETGEEVTEEVTEEATEEDAANQETAEAEDGTMPDDTELLAEHMASSTATVTQTDDETIIEDFEAGFWYYYSVSQGLRVVINRYRVGERDVLWYETDIRTCAATPLHCVSSNPESPGRQPFRLSDRIARENDMVLAISGDMFGYRKYNKQKQGVILRDGVVLADQTRKHGVKSFPNLDLIALYADGSMEAFESNAHTAEEYLAMGVTDTFCFGPWLVHNGEVNPETEKNWQSTERRIAIGYVSPYHYVVVYNEGWNSTSAGASLEWVAKKIQEMGAIEAVNLDGGHSAALIFMGKKLQLSNPTGVVKKERALDSVIGLGTSEYVAEYNGVGK